MESVRLICTLPDSPLYHLCVHDTGEVCEWSSHPFNVEGESYLLILKFQLFQEAYFLVF